MGDKLTSKAANELSTGFIDLFQSPTAPSGGFNLASEAAISRDDAPTRENNGLENKL